MGQPNNILRPITPLTTSRYVKPSCIYSYHTTIPPLGISLGHPKSSWTSYLHPEGQRYFQRQFSHYCVVTEANLDSKEIENGVHSWLKSIDDVVSSQQIVVPASSELFIELDDSMSSCAYYFVNHHTKRPFWLEQTTTELLDIGTVVSSSHVDTALERLYWIHVEFFPTHICVQMSPCVVDDLISVMSHGAADRLTSRSSTFPYTAEKCSQLLQLLSLRRGQPLDGPTLCFVARLWGAIENQRFMTYYGQECAQLDRLQIMTPQEDEVQHEWVKAIANPILWGIPAYYLSELHDVFTNDQVYVDQWQTFMTACVSEWHTAVVWTFPIIIIDILSCILSRASLTSALPSMLSASASLVTGSMLLLRHYRLEDATASFAAQYLRDAKARAGMLPSAIVFSLPKGLNLWSIIFMVAHLLILSSHIVGRLVLLGGVCGFIALAWVVMRVTSPEDYDRNYDGRSLLSKILSRWHSLQGGTAESPLPR